MHSRAPVKNDFISGHRPSPKGDQAGLDMASLALNETALK
jgi:hypothetical protein